MNGLDHKGFAVAGAMTVTSLMYDITPKLQSGSAANVLHPTGIPWTWPYLIHSGLRLDSIETVVMKVVFYLVLIQLASLPDRLERRKTGDFGIPGKHRGCTHSCFFLAFLILLGVMISVLVHSQEGYSRMWYDRPYEATNLCSPTHRGRAQAARSGLTFLGGLYLPS